MDMISLDDAAKLLLGDGKHTSMTTRSNLRAPFFSLAFLETSYKNTFVKSFL